MEARTYGAKPSVIGSFHPRLSRLLGGKKFQYLPVKLSQRGTHQHPRLDHTDRIIRPDELADFDAIISKACSDFVGTFGLNRFLDSFVYVTAKVKQLKVGEYANRPGWHCDGFMTKDINYVWTSSPTLYNFSEFNLTQDDQKSMEEMEQQALHENNYEYYDSLLLRLDQYVVHRSQAAEYDQFRSFIKISFSEDVYNLEGNSRNSKLNFFPVFRPRLPTRNIPQRLP